MDSKIDIAFLGLAQNCEKYLPKFFNVIKEISQKKKIEVFIGENGSNDYTFSLIQKNIVNNDKNINFIDTTFIEEFDDRIKRLALARQTLKNTLIQSKLKPKFVCVVDLDDVLNHNFNTKMIDSLTVLLDKKKDQYFGISVNSKPYYYDILNFESEEFPNRYIKNLQNNKSIKSYKDRRDFIYRVQHSLTKKKYFDCISGFNGLCIYRYEEYITSNYVENIKDQTPEHLLFNRCLNKTLDKKILVTDNFFKMPDEHKPLNNIFHFIFEKMLKYLNIYLNKLFN
jgi:hypothetical protein